MQQKLANPAKLQSSLNCSFHDKLCFYQMWRLKFLDRKQVSDDSDDQCLICKSPPSIASIWFCLQYGPLFVLKWIHDSVAILVSIKGAVTMQILECSPGGRAQEDLAAFQQKKGFALSGIRPPAKINHV